MQGTKTFRGVETSPALPEDHHKTIYLEVVDTVTTCIIDRFAQEGYQMYSKGERLLVEKDQTENEAAKILMFYNDDFEKDTLLT